MTKEEMKKFLTLDEPIFVSKFAPVLAPYAKIVYLIGLVILAVTVLAALMTLLTGGIASAFLTLVVVVVEFILFRMFCEFLMTHGK